MSKILDISLMTQFDIFVLVFLFFSVVFAFFKGFVKTALSFASLVFIAFLSIELSFLFSPVLQKYLISYHLSVVITALLLFMLFLLIMSFINNILFLIISPLSGGLMDRLLGLVLGVFRGCAIASFVFYIMTLFVPALMVKDNSDVFYDNRDLPSWARNSESLLFLSRGARVVSHFIPSDFNKSLRKAILESKDSKGEFDLPNRRIEDIQDLNKIFSLLPEPVLDETPQKDILTLQDPSADMHVKVKILEEIASRYQSYINDRASYSTDDLRKINKKYHEVISALNEEIAKYNSMLR